MKIDSAVRARLGNLEARALALTDVPELTSTTDRHRAECVAWLTAAQNIVHLICANPATPYRASVDRICGRGPSYIVHQYVGEVAAILRALLLDIDAGLLSSVSDQAVAEAFDDFLDHATAYLEARKKNESGVIAGVVFEDTLRKICRKAGLSEKGVALDSLISALTSNGALTAAKAKRARAAAHVRTKATHAQWDEFALDDVKATIEFTRELISAKLDSP